jgi:hypothetical protein
MDFSKDLRTSNYLFFAITSPQDSNDLTLGNEYYITGRRKWLKWGEGIYDWIKI